MPREIFTFRKKIILTFSYILLIVALVLSSNYLNLNETSQRYLVKALKIPENFIENISQEFKEYESLKIVELENEIIKLKNDIYEVLITWFVVFVEGSDFLLLLFLKLIVFHAIHLLR